MTLLTFLECISAFLVLLMNSFGLKNGLLLLSEYFQAKCCTDITNMTHISTFTVI